MLIRRSLYFITLFALPPLVATAYADTGPTSLSLAIDTFRNGFTYCNQAQRALLKEELGGALQLIEQYETYRKQALSIDQNLLITQERDMPANLRYCDQVRADIMEAKVGPLLTQSYVACEDARQQLQSGNLGAARLSIRRFKRQSSRALAQAPTIKNRFVAKQKLNTCEALHAEVRQTFDRQQTRVAQLENTIIGATTLRQQCEAGLPALIDLSQASPPATQVPAGARTELSRLQDWLTRIQQETLSADAFLIPKPDTRLQRQSEASQGASACVMHQQSLLAELERNAKAESQRVQRTANRLNEAQRLCASINQIALSDVSESSYREARSQLEKAVIMRNQMQQQLQADESLRKQVRRRMDNLSACIDQSKQHLSDIFTNMPRSRPALPQTAAHSEEQQGAPAAKAKVTVRLMNAFPPIIVAFWVDGKRPDTPDALVIDRNGLVDNVVAASSNTQLVVRNLDPHPHTITVQPESGPERQWRIASGHEQTLTVDWPENTIAAVSLAANPDRVTWVANVSGHQWFSGYIGMGSSTLEFELANVADATTFGLLIPGFDPISVAVAQGEIKSEGLYRSGMPQGNVLIRGL